MLTLTPVQYAQLTSLRDDFITQHRRIHRLAEQMLYESNILLAQLEPLAALLERVRQDAT